MRYASKVAMCRVQIPKLAYDNNTLEFWYTGDGSATFDPSITTSKSTTIVWQTSDGRNVTIYIFLHWPDLEFIRTPAPMDRGQDLLLPAIIIQVARIEAGDVYVYLV
jgi:hypothetical protein